MVEKDTIRYFVGADGFAHTQIYGVRANRGNHCVAAFQASSFLDTLDKLMRYHRECVASSSDDSLKEQPDRLLVSWALHPHDELISTMFLQERRVLEGIVAMHNQYVSSVMACPR